MDGLELLGRRVELEIIFLKQDSMNMTENDEKRAGRDDLEKVIIDPGKFLGIE